MGYLVSRNPKLNARSTQAPSSSGRLDQGTETYNRSSLAFDLQQNGGALAWDRPMPQLVSYSALVRTEPTRRMFVGLDVATARKDSRSKTISIILHAGILGAVIWWGVTEHHIVKVQDSVIPIRFSISDPPPRIMPVAKIEGGGGSGGERKPIPPVRAEPPKPAPRTQLLPAQIAKLQNPKLAAEPTSQVNMQLANNLPNIGIPDAPQIALASQGPGSHSAFGSGMGGGIGVGHSNGNGIGGGGGYGGGVMSVGGGVSAPEVIHSVDPLFTDEARSANLQGTVAIQLIVDSQGNPQAAQVVRHLGMGLDQKAIEAIRQYKFRPAVYQGHPVAVQLVIEIDFRLH
jgi:TonB family protein